MKILRLTTQNFRQHAASDILFPSQGIIGLIGPNESGKSTLLEAIAFALYGIKAIRGNKTGLRWHRAYGRKQADVTLVIELAGALYTIWRSETDATVYDALGAKLATGTTQVNFYLPRILGMALDEFRATFLCEQKDLARIASMRGVERRQFFLEILGIGRIDTALANCRVRKNELAREVEGLAIGLGEREELVTEFQTTATALIHDEKALKAAITLQEDARKFSAEQDAILDASTQRQRRWREMQSEITGGIVAVTSAERELAAERAEEAGAQAAVQRLIKSEGTLAPLPGLIAERDALVKAQLLDMERTGLAGERSQIIRALHDATVSNDSARQIIAAFDEVKHSHILRDAEGATRVLDEERNELASRRAEHAQLEKEVQKSDQRVVALLDAGEEGRCPTCQRVIGPDNFADVLARAEAERVSSAAEAEHYAALVLDLEQRVGHAQRTNTVTTEARQASLSQQEQAHRAADQLAIGIVYEAERLVELEAVEARLAELPATRFDAERASVVRHEILQLEQLDRDQASDRQLAGRLSELERQVRTRQAALEEAIRWRDALHQAAADVRYDPEEHEVLAALARDADGERQECERLVVRCRAEEEAATQRKDRAAYALTLYDARAEILRTRTAELRAHESAARRLAEFRNAQAATIQPELEELVSGFVQLLTDGRHESVALNEDFEVTTYESGVPIDVASGGLEDVIALSMRLAISQMIAERAGHPLSLLILDEPFTSLDEIRRGGALALIRRLQSVFAQVVLVSHIPDLRESCDFAIEISFDEATGQSRIREGSLPLPELQQAVAS